MIQKIAGYVALYFVAVATTFAEPQIQSGSLGMYGAPGVIDMPNAEALPDGQINFSFSGFNDFQKAAFAFQISPRLTGVLRYSGLSNYTNTGARVLDRSFDLHFQIRPETARWPALAVGLRDFMGTSIYSAQYLVATKTIRPNLALTVGAGWGRLSGTHELQPLDTGTGGVPAYDQWFRGPVGAFGGLVWDTPIAGLQAKIEYSSDLYTRENNVNDVATLSSTPSFVRKSPLNLALAYRFPNGAEMELAYLYGSEIGFRWTGYINPKSRNIGYYDTAPLPIGFRTGARNTDWMMQVNAHEDAFNELARALVQDGSRLLGLRLEPYRVRVWLSNSKYIATAQTIGRTARTLSFVLPASIEIFEIILMEGALPQSTIRINRSELEASEYAENPTARIATAMTLRYGRPLREADKRAEDWPQFSWSVAPFAQVNFSDFNDAFGLDAGIRARGRLHFSPALSLGGSVIKLVESDKTPPSNVTTLPRVRSNLGLYNQFGDPGLETFTLDYVSGLGANLYGRFTAGYLETMFGGVSAELLYSDPAKPWALGIELNAVKQRDFERQFGFQDYQTVTGHISAYFELGRDYHLQIDMGRYLAKDWGGTLTLERAFANGWRLGAFATVTDVDRASFGEGSFDKGIFVLIPLSSFSGVPTKAMFETGFRSVNSDGGARLKLDNRLYPLLRDGKLRAMQNSMARFWQ